MQLTQVASHFNVFRKASCIMINSYLSTFISISDGAAAFDEVSATIEIQDENNNPPVFIQSQFIGGMQNYL